MVPLFGDIFVSQSHFFLIFWVLGRVWRLGGSTGGQRGRHWRINPLLGTPLESILDAFFDEKVVYFCVVFCVPFWITFLLIFSDFGSLFESFFGVCLITF